MRLDSEGRDVTHMPGLHDESDTIVDFSCRVCGKQCDSAPPAPERAVCEEHCEDHEYEYDRGERDRFCKHCGKRIDPDFYSEP